MPSARSHRLSKLKKRIQAHAERSKARARQLLSTMVIAGAMSLAAGATNSSSTYALDHPADQVAGEVSVLVKNPLRDDAVDSASIEQDRQAVHQNLEYWVFSDDFCGWASVKDILQSNRSFETENAEFVASKTSVATLLDSLKLDTLLKPRSQKGNWSPIDPQVVTYEQIAMEQSLVALAAQEPVDVESSPMTLECHRPLEVASAANSSNGSSSAVSNEEYLAYDLSRADQIALRMYPMSIPHFHYLGGRRTESRSAFDYDSAEALDPALDCLGGGSIWIEEVQPSQSIEITRRSSDASEYDFGFNQAWSQMLDLNAAFQQYAGRIERESDFYRSQAGKAAIDAVQPDSAVRQLASGQSIGQTLGALQQLASGAAADQVQLIAARLSDRSQLVKSDTPSVAPEQTAGEKLLLRAGIEANTEMMAAAGVADDAANRVCCPVEQSDVASRLPATYSLAAVGVATATLKTPHAPSDAFCDELEVSSHPVVQAEALATACDSAADTLERLAKALRKAGDSFIRVARTGTDPGLTREPSAELR